MKKPVLLAAVLLPLGMPVLLPGRPWWWYSGLCLIWGALTGVIWRLPGVPQLFRRRPGSGS